MEVYFASLNRAYVSRGAACGFLYLYYLEDVESPDISLVTALRTYSLIQKNQTIPFVTLPSLDFLLTSSPTRTRMFPWLNHWHSFSPTPWQRHL